MIDLINLFSEPKEVTAFCAKCRTALRISETVAEKWKKCGHCGMDFKILGNV